ncbi:MAG TPA: hypothetical protein VFG91_05980 [Woeseiaceae bacterium]|nr:hypothetical protein [Woeseiaceae bacterium]
MAARDRFLQIRVTATEKSLIARAAARAGVDMSRWVLERALPSDLRRFHRLLEALAADSANRAFVLAELNDFLSALTPAAFARAVAETSTAALDPWLANYVAAMVETAAHRKGVEPPAWTASIAALPEPRFGSPLQSLRLHLLVNSPPAFRRRNLFIDSSIGDRV